MSADPLLLPAAHVPGGLWDAAPVAWRSRYDAPELSNRAALWHEVDGRSDTIAVALNLHDDLGLLALVQRLAAARGLPVDPLTPWGATVQGDGRLYLVRSGWADADAGHGRHRVVDLGDVTATLDALDELGLSERDTVAACVAVVCMETSR